MELPFAITLDVGTSHANRTGSWRTERPVYVQHMPPCNNDCPAGENIQQWLYLAESGDYRRAWLQIVEDNPLPAVLGRICYHPCEEACNRGKLDEAVGINSVERFLGDLAIKQRWQLPAPARGTGKRVLVIGAGPCGLSAAYHLRRLGHHVTVAEAAAKLGGMMRYAIPAYRLPRPTLDAEIDRIIALGVDVELDHPVRDIERERKDGRYDAVLLAVGAQLARRVEVPVGDSSKILDALSLLRGVETGNRPVLGRRVAVYGGGDTALDSARTARRLGASEAIVVYRRDRGHMPAHGEEIVQALGEGVTMHWLSTVKGLDHGKIVLERMTLDDKGLAQPTGEFEELDADSLVLALGQDSDLSLLEHSEGIVIDDGVVQISAQMMTGEAGVFAGGDVVPSARSATMAVGHGKRAARSIDAWLSGEEFADPPHHEIAAFSGLNTWYFADAPRAERLQLDLVRRQSTFDEVIIGLTEMNALFEARRCLSCGNCFGCDNCYGMCPDNAVIKLPLSGKYEFDYDYCKGCGICAQECPCGAIAMIPERT